jgi:CheY-like chemotaxis protein
MDDFNCRDLAAFSRLRGRREQLEAQLRRAEAFLHAAAEKLGPLEGPAGRDGAGDDGVLDASPNVRGAAWRDPGPRQDARGRMGWVPSVVVVDLDPASRVALGEILRASGYPVVEAGSSSDLPPDGACEPLLIVFDPGPHLDAGLRTVARMRIEHASAVPVVLLSATITPDQRGHALSIGCSEVLVTPCVPAELLAVVGRLAGPAPLRAVEAPPAVAHMR